MKTSSFAVERLGVAPYNWWSGGFAWCCPQWTGYSVSDNYGYGIYFDDEAIERVYVAVSDEGRAKFHDAHRRNRYGYGNEGRYFLESEL